MVQWDTAPSFDSGAGGEPLGTMLPDGATALCEACVTGFDLLAQTLTLDGSDVRGLLATDAAILVNRKVCTTAAAPLATSPAQKSLLPLESAR
jgi:hypothetical protein